ncbi:anthrone oxygenase family protein [Spirosoma sp. KNUC1025]|uniref:anthrone oxygenase family protein n=1 Tax=Spirosoma sp. KNUC1025 TaxID=2894082 RepID=UPI00386B596D|nr:DUF1772 domain-containing protein [Spirosoma sp. KNUC1025]
MSQPSEILLALFILNLGTAFGAGIYEMRIVLPQWFIKSAQPTYRVDTAAMREADTGRKFWGFVTTLPLTLLTLANVVVAWQSVQPKHHWWLAAALITLAERLVTFFFFIPTAIRLQNADTFPTADVSRQVSLWIGLNYIRNLLTLIAWIAALRAFSL